MVLSKDELYNLINTLPEKEIPIAKRILEFIVILSQMESGKIEAETCGQTFYIEGSAGKYAELEFYGHIMELDDVKGWGRLTLYEEDLEHTIFDVDFSKNQLPKIWPIYYALAAKCERLQEPFLGSFTLEEIKEYIEGKNLNFENNDTNKKNKIPKRLYVNLEVAKLMLNEGKSFKEAVSIVAKRRGVWLTTIRDECTRQMGLTVREFKKLLENKVSFINHLIEKFPVWKDFIIKEIS